jgi:trigger factor
MKTNLETVSPLERKLNIQVPASEVQAAFERAYKGIQRNAAIKGFRKGKAPIATIKSVYGDRVKQDVIQDIIQQHYATAVKELSLDPISYPAIEFDPLESDKDFAFTAEFEVRPEVKITKLEGLPVKKEKFAATDEAVNKTIEDIRKGRAETVPVLEDRAAQMGDVATIDFHGTIEGKDLEGGSAQDHTLELGSNSFIPGFEEGVVGMRIGATANIDVKFPDGYHAAELSGKPVTFKVTLKGLKKKSLPEVNDEFAKGLGDYADLAALKKAIREDVEKREGKRIHDELKNRIMRVLVDHNPVPVPKSLMTEQKKALVADFEKRMQQQGMDQKQFEEYKGKWDKDFEQTSAYMIQSSFLIDKIAADQGFKATAADFDAKLQEYASQTGIEFKRIAEFYAEKDKRARLAYQITEEKVLDYLISKAKVSEVSKEEIQKDEPQDDAQDA